MNDPRSNHNFVKWWVDIKNPAGWLEYDRLGLGELRRDGFDGVILPKSNGTFDGFVFSPKQIRNVPPPHGVRYD
jgi:hypothetical protein